MFERLEESDVEMSKVDREMFNRINATEDGLLMGRIEDVTIENPDRTSDEFIKITAQTPAGTKKDSFELPETPTDSDKIVKLCKQNNVDPKYPSMLEGCTVKFDGNEIHIPKPWYVEFSDDMNKMLIDEDRFSKTKKAFFTAFLPITLTTYYLVLHRSDRNIMRRDFLQYSIHIALWLFASFLIILGPLFMTLI